jgi:hypothetical protein
MRRTMPLQQCPSRARRRLGSRMDDALMVMDESIMKFAAEEKHWQEQRCAFSLQTAIATRSRKKQRETA